MTDTPAAHWRERGEPDPHGDRYDCARSETIGGQYTDDEVANMAYFQMHEPEASIVKDRIRWLSRQVVKSQST